MTDVSEQADRVAAGFEERYGRPPEGVWAAPGRVNLIGEHTDYNDGFVLPFALAERAWVAAARRDGGRLRAASVQQDGDLNAEIAGLAPGAVDGWAAYVAGVAWSLAAQGVTVPGADLFVDGRVPLGAGLSSSAALECAAGAALLDLAGASFTGPELARAAQRAENDFVGAPTGLLDQTASVLCAAGHALLLDCRSGETRQVPFDPAAEGLRLLVVDTGVQHAHSESGYGERRKACERAAEALGVPSLRDATETDLTPDRLPDPVLLRRARHVVGENSRVLAAVSALEADDWTRLGELMTASHASLRDDYEVSCPELDAVVEAALAAGALGARMTGGGFGGSAIVLVAAHLVEATVTGVRDRFAGAGWPEPEAFTAEPSDGATRIR